MQIKEMLIPIQFLIVLSLSVTAIMIPSWETTLIGIFVILWIGFTQWLERFSAAKHRAIEDELLRLSIQLKGVESKLSDMKFVSAMRTKER